MELILNSLIPLTFVIALGWLAGYKKIVNHEHSSTLATYVMSFSFPCLLIVKTASSPLSDLINIRFMLGFALGLMGMYLIAFIVNKYIYQRNIAESIQASFVCAFPDMAFMGIPIFSVLFSSQALISIVVGNIITSLIMIPLTVSILDIYSANKSGRSTMQLILGVCKKPLVVAPLVGILISASGYKIPAIAHDSLLLIGSTTSGVSLFALGLIMSADRIMLNKYVLLNIFKKLIIHPLLMWLIIVVLGITGDWSKEAILLCAMPSAIMTTMFAVKYDVLKVESSSTTVVGTVVALFSMATIMYLLGIGH